MLKLSQSEAAIVRGWLQGLSLEDLARTYLDDFSGNAASYLRKLLNALVLKANRVGHPEWARYFQAPPRSESEQAKALLALEELNRLEDPNPHPTHPVEWWLPKPLAAACRKQAIATLGELREGGWQRLPGNGADWVRKWLVAQGWLTETPEEKAFLPLVLVSPKALEGQEHRAEEDYAAVGAWLSLWPPNSPTFKAYRKEVERFLLWCHLERGKAFLALTPNDCSAYLNFLRHVPAAWQGPARPRSSPAWKPFRRPLSERSVRQAEIILSSLCSWLVKQGYLAQNPFEALPKRRFSVRMRTDHALSEAQWRFLLDFSAQKKIAAKTQEARQKAIRWHFALKLAYLTGLRLSEMAKATLGDIETLTRPEGLQHWLHVSGKGGRPRMVPLPPQLVTDLLAYLATRGYCLSRLEEAPLDAPLLASIRQKTLATKDGFTRAETPLSPLALHLMFKEGFQQAGEALAKTDPEAGRRLRQATAHWLRHTHASHALDRGVPLTVVRDNLGHASIQTTSLYVHKQADERFREIKKLLD